VRTPYAGRLRLPTMLLALICVLVACDDGPLDDDDDDAGSCDPGREHIDEAALADALSWLDSNPTWQDSMLVQHCGERYVEQYWNGYDATTPHDLQSATKTFTATLIGIAIGQGLIDGVDQPLTELLPDHAHLLTGDKALITLEHLLTMTSGLRWVDFGLGNSFDLIAAADDSVAFVLGEPLETAPGEVFHYNTGSSHLLSAIVAHHGGMTTAQYAEQHLFGPLEIADFEWPALADGIQQGGWGLHMKPPDFLKLGQLLLDEGTWQDQRIVSADYVDAMTSFQVSNGMGGGYGYQMWLETDLFDADDIAGARGYGGQDCLVLDELELVVVFTGDIFHPAEMAADVVTVTNGFVIPSHVGQPHDAL
jgi:CubicO group peptidase (beta-lactamase class C family)